MALSSAIRAGQAFIELSLDETQFIKDLKNLDAKLNAFAKRINKIGRSLFFGGAAALTPFGFGLKAFSDFEFRLEKIRAITERSSGLTAKAYQQVIDKARELGRTTMFQPTEVAEGMEILARAGFNAADNMQAIGPTLSAAVVGEMSVAEATDITTGVLRGMQLQASETGRVVDVLTMAAISSQTDIREMGNAFKFAGSLAQLGGEKIETVAAALQILAQGNVRGEMAGTAIRGIISQLTDLPREAEQMLRQMRVQTIDPLTGDFVGLESIIGQLQKRFEGLGSGQILNRVSTIFRQRQAQGIAKLIMAGAGEFRAAVENLENSSQGVATEIRDILEETLAGRFVILKSAIHDVNISIGEIIGVPLKHLLSAVTKVVERFNEWIKANRGLVFLIFSTAIVVTGLGAAMLGLGAAITVASVAINLFMTALIPIVAILKFLLFLVMGVIAPFLGAAAVIGAVVVAGIALYKVIRIVYENFALLTAAANMAGNTLMASFQTAAAMLRAVASAIAGQVRLVAAMATQLGALLVEGIGNELSNIWQRLISDPAIKAYRLAIGLVSGLLQHVVRVQTQIAGWFNKLMRAVFPPVAHFLDHVKIGFSFWPKWLGRSLSQMGGTISRFVASARRDLMDAIGSVSSFASSALRDATAWFTTLVRGVADLVNWIRHLKFNLGGVLPSFITIGKQASMMLQWLNRQIVGVGRTAIATLNVIVDALRTGNLSGAARVAFLGIKLAFAEFFLDIHNMVAIVLMDIAKLLQPIIGGQMAQQIQTQAQTAMLAAVAAVTATRMMFEAEKKKLQKQAAADAKKHQQTLQDLQDRLAPAFGGAGGFSTIGTTIGAAASQLGGGPGKSPQKLLAEMLVWLQNTHVNTTFGNKQRRILIRLIERQQRRLNHLSALLPTLDKLNKNLDDVQVV